MKKRDLFQRVISSILILSLLAIAPVSAAAQTKQLQQILLIEGTDLKLHINEDVKFNNSGKAGIIHATVKDDVYSSDGNSIVIKSGTPANIEYSFKESRSWGRPGQVCVVYGSTRTIDAKRVPFILNSCQEGKSALGAVIFLTVLFFPLGLLSQFITGSNPKIKAGTTFTGVVTEDVVIE